MRILLLNSPIGRSVVLRYGDEILRLRLDRVVRDGMSPHFRRRRMLTLKSIAHTGASVLTAGGATTFDGVKIHKVCVATHSAASDLTTCSSREGCEFGDSSPE